MRIIAPKIWLHAGAEARPIKASFALEGHHEEVCATPTVSASLKQGGYCATCGWILTAHRRDGSAEKIASAAHEAAAVRAEGDAARAAEREAGARALRAAVEAARPALPLIAERNDYVIEGEPVSLWIATLGGRTFGDARVQLGLDRTGAFVDVAFEYEKGAWKPTSISPVSAEFVACYYDVEKLVAALLRAVEAQAQSKGTRLRARQARAKARRLGAIAALIDACAQEGGGR